MLRVRRAEHRMVFNNKDLKNGIAMYGQETAHTINWKETKIFGWEENWGRRVLEALVIEQRR